MCVILCTEIDGKQILAKNRDRNYKPFIEIVHEIVNGIEVAYIKDKYSGWIEGMNETGFGLVNSTLSITDGKINKKKLTKKNNIIYKALTEKHIGENFYDIINDTKNHYALEGHTILFYNNELIHFENNKKNEFVAEKIKNSKVYSNYGINLKKEGHTKCIKGMSSFLRANIIKKELQDHKIDSIEKLTQIMNTNYKNINPRFHPYRDKQYSRKKNRHNPGSFNVSTTGQIIFNMTDLIFTYYTDVNNSENVKYINKLPKDHTPKIRIIIKETKKQIENPKTIFTKKYLKEIEQKFYCGKTKKNIHKNSNNKTFKNRFP
jgi:hypothetical protein